MNKAIVVFSAVAIAMAVASVHGAGTIDQEITLRPGWTAVYVSVSPTNSADQVFAEWPVNSVSAYNADAFLNTIATTGGRTGESTVRPAFWIWSRESPESSSLKRLRADSVLVCFSTNAVEQRVLLRGVPAAPRIAWHVSNDQNNAPRNMVGVRLTGQVKASEWFAGCPALERPDSKSFYYISGPDEAEPRIRQVATGNKVAYLNDGDVVYVPGSEVSDWSGPLYISPRAGVDFSTEGMIDEISIRNDGEGEKTVNVKYTASSDGTGRPELLCRESYGENATGEWTELPFGGVLTRTLSTGETWKVALALDRTKLPGTGSIVGGVLEIAEEGGTRSQAWIPVTAVDVKPLAPWPQGLWIASIKLTKVSYYQADGKRTDGVASGGAMGVRALLYVDAEGGVKLVQRATVGSSRISSAFLPVDLGAVAPARGEFGDASSPLAFNYTIAANSPSNPFRHALHPLFDGKQADFKTPAPDGDNIANYQGAVKPEWFSIGGEIEFSFDKNAANAWTPVESLTGDAKWTYTGVRRDGPVVAEGRFTMRRVAKEAKIGE